MAGSFPEMFVLQQGVCFHLQEAGGKNTGAFRSPVLKTDQAAFRDDSSPWQVLWIRIDSLSVQPHSLMCQGCAMHNSDGGIMHKEDGRHALFMDINICIPPFFVEAGGMQVIVKSTVV